jgi:hypothetical protein
LSDAFREDGDALPMPAMLAALVFRDGCQPPWLRHFFLRHCLILSSLIDYADYFITDFFILLMIIFALLLFH